MTPVQKSLFAMQDQTYRTFHARLVPTIDPDRIIGIRTPQLRAFAKAFSKLPEASVFLEELPHVYYEENNLHAFLIEQFKDFNAALAAAEAFLPYIDNWATCDSFLPKVFRHNPKPLLPKIRQWIASSKTYTVRFGIELLMKLYLDDRFQPEYLDWVAKIQSEEYYINMMIAWYFSEALAKQYDLAIAYLKQNRLDCWVHNKAIQKAMESRRISPKTKEYLKTLKRK